MIYRLYPGSPIPKLIVGDTVIIMGKSFPYRGEVESKASMPLVQGIYKCIDTENYYLRHSIKDTEIIHGYTNHLVKEVATDNTPVTREKKNKDIFVLTILPEDNFLKVILKRILIKLRIDFNDYRHKFMSDNHFNNTKRAIQGGSNISFEKFVEILDILDLKYKIDIFTKDGEPFDISINDIEMVQK
jgi:hypothetical protein